MPSPLWDGALSACPSRRRRPQVAGGGGVLSRKVDGARPLIPVQSGGSRSEADATHPAQTDRAGSAEGAPGGVDEEERDDRLGLGERALEFSGQKW